MTFIEFIRSEYISKISDIQFKEYLIAMADTKNLYEKEDKEIVWVIDFEYIIQDGPEPWTIEDPEIKAEYANAWSY